MRKRKDVYKALVHGSRINEKQHASETENLFTYYKIPRTRFWTTMFDFATARFSVLLRANATRRYQVKLLREIRSQSDQTGKQFS